MKICLVNPPNENELTANDPVIIKENQGCLPPLGLMSIAAYLIQEGFGEVSIIDAQAEGLSATAVGRRVADLNPDIVGLTVMTFTLVDVMETIKEIRKNVNTHVVIGGPHCSIFRSNRIGDIVADSVIIGEGELSFLQLCRDYPNCKEVYETPYIEDLDVLPYPARHLSDPLRYSSILSANRPITTAFSSRGCPYACTFCDRPALGKRFRFRSANKVVDEMEWCQRQGIKEIFFYDDTFTINRQRVDNICCEYSNRNLSIKWDIRARVNTVDESLLGTLARAGVTRIHFGIESAVPRILRELNKGITREQVYQAFDSCKKLGIKTLAYFMLGNPTETTEDIKENIRMIERIRPDYVHMTILTLFPGTQIYAQAQQEGLISGDPWLTYSHNPRDKFDLPMWESIYSRAEHEKHLKWMYRRFYLRPRYVFDKILEIRNPGQFQRYCRAFLGLLKM